MSNNDRDQNDETEEGPLRKQVLEEFVDAAERGKAGRESLARDGGDPQNTLPPPLDTKDDASWANISVDQLGKAMGLTYQDEEPLNTIEKIDERDDNRWSMDQASAEDPEREG